MYRAIALSAALIWLACHISMAQQDSTKAKPDTAAVKKIMTDSLRPPTPPPVLKPKIPYRIDTSYEAVNLERLYYGMDGRDSDYDYNPWDEYINQDADGRQEDERDQRDQERDSRE